MASIAVEPTTSYHSSYPHQRVHALSSNLLPFKLTVLSLIRIRAFFFTRLTTRLTGWPFYYLSGQMKSQYKCWINTCTNVPTVPGVWNAKHIQKWILLVLVKLIPRSYLHVCLLDPKGVNQPEVETRGLTGMYWLFRWLWMALLSSIAECVACL